MDKYHETFIPLPDIYTAGGAVFDHLARKQHEDSAADAAKHYPEKNLLVVSPAIIAELEHRRERDGDAGAAKALAWLKPLRFGLEGKDGFPVAHTGDRLDIAMIDGVTKHKQPEGLERMVSEVTALCGKVRNKGFLPKVITNIDALHVRLNARDITVEESQFLQVDAHIVGKGMISGNASLWEALEKAGQKGLPAETVADALEQHELYPNQFIKFARPDSVRYARVSGTLRRNSDGTRVVSVEDIVVRPLPPEDYDKQMRQGAQYAHKNVLGVKPLDMEQMLAFQYGLLNPDVELFFLCGSQGSGKTLLSYVAAVEQILNHNALVKELRKGGVYSHVMLVKPNDVIGGAHREIGFLPGSMLDKIKPHMGPFIEAHRESVLGGLFPFDDMFKHPEFPNDFGPVRSKKGGAKIPDAAMTDKKYSATLPPKSEAIEIAYSGFLRGRSIKNVVCIVSEAQNFTPYELKCIIERMGPGSKMIIEGDPWQVDNPECSIAVNGLTHAIKHYLGRPYVALVQLLKNHRSQMSDDARDWGVFSTSKAR